MNVFKEFCCHAIVNFIELSWGQKIIVSILVKYFTWISVCLPM